MDYKTHNPSVTKVGDEDIGSRFGIATIIVSRWDEKKKSDVMTVKKIFDSDLWDGEPDHYKKVTLDQLAGLAGFKKSDMSNGKVCTIVLETALDGEIWQCGNAYPPEMVWRFHGETVGYA